MKQIIIVLFSLISIPNQAQFSIGFDLGYDYNHLNTPVSNKIFTKNTNIGGYSSSFQINYNFNNLFSLKTGFGLLQKNYSFTRTGDYLGVYETFTNFYFQVPINVQLKIIEIRKFKLFVFGGIFSAYWAFAKVHGATPNIFNSTNTVGNDGQIIQYLTLANYSEKYQFNAIKDKRFEFGFVTGLSINYGLNSNFSIFLEPKYYQSLTDQQKQYMVNQVPKINQTLCISIGCLMKLPSNKK